MTNASNQTALDIARFWGYKNIANLLSDVKDGLQPFQLASQVREPENYFSKMLLDRKSEKRVDSQWLNMKQKQPTTVYILFSNLSPLVTSDGDSEDSFHSPKTKLCRLCYKDVKEYLKQPGTNTLVFLGVELQMKGSLLPTAHGQESCESEDDGLVAWFALNVDAAADKFLQERPGCYYLHPPMPALLQLSEHEAGKCPVFSVLILGPDNSDSFFTPLVV